MRRPRKFTKISCRGAIAAAIHALAEKVETGRGHPIEIAAYRQIQAILEKYQKGENE